MGKTEPGVARLALPRAAKAGAAACRAHAGFTMIELMVVVVVLAVLLTVAVPSFEAAMNGSDHPGVGASVEGGTGEQMSVVDGIFASAGYAPAKH